MSDALDRIVVEDKGELYTLSGELKRKLGGSWEALTS